jgi:hypothetical protein
MEQHYRRGWSISQLHGGGSLFTKHGHLLAGRIHKLWRKTDSVEVNIVELMTRMPAVLLQRLWGAFPIIFCGHNLWDQCPGHITLSWVHAGWWLNCGRSLSPFICCHSQALLLLFLFLLLQDSIRHHIDLSINLGEKWQKGGRRREVTEGSLNRISQKIHQLGPGHPVERE